MLGNYRVAAQLVASLVVLSSTELVTLVISNSPEPGAVFKPATSEY
jgi:hypothetical protein